MYKIWNYNDITGFWKIERECEAGLENEWLAQFYRGEPAAIFRLSRNKPKGKPNRRDRQTKWLMLNRWGKQ